MPEFPNWFNSNIPSFEKHLGGWAGRPRLQFLQIGAYTGDASTWLLDRVLTGTGASLTDVDTWGGSEGEVAHESLDWGAVWAAYRRRMRGRCVTPMRMESDEFFDFIGPARRYDFIYVDGDHHSQQVWRDAKNADAHLRVGGVLGFDDYEWAAHSDPPKAAIDEFLDVHGHRYDLLEKGAQVWLRKNAEA